jgi:hypothetical protein
VSSESRLERRLDALLSHASRNSIRAWLSIWGVLVLLGFRCPLALATRALLAGAAAISFWRGHPIAGGIVLAFFLTYLLQVPLILGVAFGERELRRDRSQA